MRPPTIAKTTRRGKRDQYHLALATILYISSATHTATASTQQLAHNNRLVAHACASADATTPADVPKPTLTQLPPAGTNCTLRVDAAQADGVWVTNVDTDVFAYHTKSPSAASYTFQLGSPCPSTMTAHAHYGASPASNCAAAAGSTLSWSAIVSAHIASDPQYEYTIADYSAFEALQESSRPSLAGVDYAAGTGSVTFNKPAIGELAAVGIGKPFMVYVKDGDDQVIFFHEFDHAAYTAGTYSGAFAVGRYTTKLTAAVSLGGVQVSTELDLLADVIEEMQTRLGSSPTALPIEYSADATVTGSSLYVSKTTGGSMQLRLPSSCASPSYLYVQEGNSSGRVATFVSDVDTVTFFTTVPTLLVSLSCGGDPVQSATVSTADAPAYLASSVSGDASIVIRCGTRVNGERWTDELGHACLCTNAETFCSPPNSGALANKMTNFELGCVIASGIVAGFILLGGVLFCIRRAQARATPKSNPIGFSVEMNATPRREQRASLTASLPPAVQVHKGLKVEAI